MGVCFELVMDVIWFYKCDGDYRFSLYLCLRSFLLLLYYSFREDLKRVFVFASIYTLTYVAPLDVSSSYSSLVCLR